MAGKDYAECGAQYINSEYEPADAKQSGHEAEPSMGTSRMRQGSGHQSYNPITGERVSYMPEAVRSFQVERHTDPDGFGTKPESKSHLPATPAGK